jgi:hypothetical protein
VLQIRRAAHGHGFMAFLSIENFSGESTCRTLIVRG